MVVDDAVFERLKAVALAAQVKKLHLLSGDISKSGFAALVNNLRERNGYDATYWSTPYHNNLHEEDEARMKQEDMRPVYRGELLDRELEFERYALLHHYFLGALFIIASGLVLYHKVLSDINMQKESMRSLKRLGVTRAELQQLISKELAIIFMLPAVSSGAVLFLCFVQQHGRHRRTAGQSRNRGRRILRGADCLLLHQPQEVFL
jgi:hypothetical protein